METEQIINLLIKMNTTLEKMNIQINKLEKTINKQDKKIEIRDNLLLTISKELGLMKNAISVNGDKIYSKLDNVK